MGLLGRISTIGMIQMTENQKMILKNMFEVNGKYPVRNIL